MEGLTDELEFARGPVFGEAETAGFLGQLNKLTEQAGQNITNRLAATGGLRSGSAEQQLTNLELSRGGEAARFFSELPFRERQARLQATLPLLQTGLGFAGRGPTQQVQTTDQTSQFDFDETSTQQSQEDLDVEGPGFLSSLAGAGGELLGGLLGENPSDPFALFRRRSSSPGISTSEIPLGAGQGNRLQNILDLMRVNPINFGGGF